MCGVTVSRESTGKYYASILADDGLPEIEQLPHIEQITGIDLGLKDALVSSVGRKSGNPETIAPGALEPEAQAAGHDAQDRSGKGALRGRQGGG